MRPLFDVTEEMTITDADPDIVVLEMDGRLRTLRPDGRKRKSDGGDAEVKTRWDKERLVVETSRTTGPDSPRRSALRPMDANSASTPASTAGFR
jgi:hypothetical protein